jgi:hypothetical protein
MAGNNETRGGLGGLSRPGLAGPRSRRRDAVGPVNDTETKGEYRYRHGDSITEVRGPCSAGFQAQVHWIAGHWIAGHWIAGHWGRRVRRGWLAGCRATGRHASGVESTGSRCTGPIEFSGGGEIGVTEQWA